MRTGLSLLLALLTLGAAATAAAARPSDAPAARWGAALSTGGFRIPALDLPDRALTPGAVFPRATRAQVCTPGYSAGVRDVPYSLKAAVYARYGVVWTSRTHEVDHLISLELGGSNSILNLWPERYGARWGARVKDRLENRLHDLVCSGSMTLRRAQHLIAVDWPKAYLRYIGEPPAWSGSGGSTGSGSSGSGSAAGGYYLSSHPSASTIYCASSSGWKSLSATYLRHFDTLAAALAAFPGYHLASGC